MANRNSPPVTTECKSVLLYSVWIRTLADAMTKPKFLLNLPNNRLAGSSGPWGSGDQRGELDVNRPAGSRHRMVGATRKWSFIQVCVDRAVGLSRPQSIARGQHRAEPAVADQVARRHRLGTAAA